MPTDPTVFIVDDDEAVRRSLRRLIASAGMAVEDYATAEEYADRCDLSRPGCLVLDVRMPGMSGLELQKMLQQKGMKIPVIIISGHGDVPKAVQAMKGGAVDFIEKPFKGEVLLDRIRQAIELDGQVRRRQARRAEVQSRLALLTPREREVMELLATGTPVKQVAYQLGLSRKTVDVHRSHIMMKLQIDSLVELVRMLEVVQQPSGRPPTHDPPG